MIIINHNEDICEYIMDNDIILIILYFSFIGGGTVSIGGIVYLMLKYLP
jgi:hypothetical protein